MKTKCIYCKFYIEAKEILFGLGLTKEECKKDNLKTDKYPYKYRSFEDNASCPYFKKSGWRYFLWKGRGR